MVSKEQIKEEIIKLFQQFMAEIKGTVVHSYDIIALANTVCELIDQIVTKEPE